MWRIANTQDIVEVTAFCGSTLPAKWSLDAWIPYLKYYIDRRFLAVFGNPIQGVIFGRPVMSPEGCVNDRYSWNRNGRVLWVEGVSLKASSMRDAVLFAIEALKEQGIRFSSIAFNRQPFRSEPTKINLKRFLCMTS